MVTAATLAIVLCRGGEATVMAKCFVIMPISMPDIYAGRYNDSQHFNHVLDYLFIPALEAAGYETVPPAIAGSDLIQAEIISNLETCDMVLCDISTLNPNVFFELGIRTSLDRPVALVRDNFTVQIPFDTGSINTHTYDASLYPWTLSSEVAALTLHIQNVTARSADRNALWRYFGLTQRASPAEISNPTDAKLDLLIDEVGRLARRSDPAPNPPRMTVDVSEHRSVEYERRAAAAITNMGYIVRSTTRDIGFDLIIEDADGHIIFAELKYPLKPLTIQTVEPIISRASAASAPVLLIFGTEITVEAYQAAADSGNLQVLYWRGTQDDGTLGEKLREMFASIPSPAPIATNDPLQ